MKKHLYVALLAFGVAMMMAPPAMAQDEKPFVIHGEFRFRGDYIANQDDLDDNADDQALFWPYRARIAAEGKFGKNVGVWIEFQNASVAGAVSPFKIGIGSDEDEGDSPTLYQASVSIDKLWSDNFSVRIGRQEMVAGNELLLGDLDFYTGIAHDGLTGNWKFDKWNLMFWYTRPSEDSVSDDDGSDPPDGVFPVSSTPGTDHFVGAYATWAWKKQSFDVYLMNMNESGPGEDIQTLGVRWARDNQNEGLFWSAEFALQSGDVAPTIDAGGDVFEGWIGYNINKKHAVYGKFVMASGDDAATAGENEGFITLFGDFHNRAGRGDWFRLDDDTTDIAAFSVGGLEALSVGYTGRVSDKAEWGAAYWQYTVAETAGGAPDDLGQAIDVYINYNYSRNLTFTASLSQLSPDDALTGGAAPDDDVTRLYGQARVRF